MSLYPRLDDLLELRHQAHALGLPSHHLVNSTFSGLYASVFRGAGVNFEEVREYREGDDIRYMLAARQDQCERTGPEASGQQFCRFGHDTCPVTQL